MDDRAPDEDVQGDSPCKDFDPEVVCRPWLGCNFWEWFKQTFNYVNIIAAYMNHVPTSTKTEATGLDHISAPPSWPDKSATFMHIKEESHVSSVGKFTCDAPTSTSLRRSMEA